MSAWNRFRTKNKFGAKRTADGFPSMLERAVYHVLLLREKAGEIRDIRRQHCVDLGLGVRWKVDFSFEVVATGLRRFAEAKGLEDAGYKIKKRMWKNGAGIGELEIWKGSWRRPALAETVIPNNINQQSLDNKSSQEKGNGENGSRNT